MDCVQDAQRQTAPDADLPALPRLVCDLYRDASPPLRVGLLECLIRPVRPLGLVAVAAGAFGGFLHRERWSRPRVPIEDAVRFSADQVFELARFVEQAQPEAFRQIAQLLADHPAGRTTLSGALLLASLRLHWRETPAATSDTAAVATVIASGGR